MKRSFLLSLCLSLLWMGLIFYLSSQPAEESTDTSLTVGKAAASLLVPGFSDWEEERQIAFAEKIDHPIRKLAHATEYAVLAFLLGLDWLLLPDKIRQRLGLGQQDAQAAEPGLEEKLRAKLGQAGEQGAGLGQTDAHRHGLGNKQVCGKWRNRSSLFLPFLSAAFYACTDEFHQLFVPGRAGMLSDVLLDSAGAAAGLLLLSLLSRHVKPSKN